MLESCSSDLLLISVLPQLELKKTLLDRMVHLLSRGYVLPVVSYIRKCLEKLDTDISLIRYFVTEVSSECIVESGHPPLSQPLWLGGVCVIPNSEIHVFGDYVHLCCVLICVLCLRGGGWGVSGKAMGPAGPLTPP